MRKRDSINSIISDMSFDEYELDVDRRNIKLFEEKEKPLHKVLDKCLCIDTFKSEHINTKENYGLFESFVLFRSGQAKTEGQCFPEG